MCVVIIVLDYDIVDGNQFGWAPPGNFFDAHPKALRAVIQTLVVPVVAVASKQDHRLPIPGH